MQALTYPHRQAGGSIKAFDLNADGMKSVGLLFIKFY